MINRFIDVFEDNASLSNKFNNNTQSFIHKAEKKKETKSSDVFNLKIEAPVLLVPENQRLWVADLGTFNITKAGVEMEESKELVLEGKNAKVYFIDFNIDLPNLNKIITQPSLIQDFLPKMKLVVTDLEFNIDLFDSEYKDDLGQVKLVKNLNFDIHPFKINLFDSALQSLLSLAISIGEDTKREKAFVDKLLKKGEIFKSATGVEYDIGYEVWEQSILVLEGQKMFTVSEDHRVLASQDISYVTKTGLDQGSDQFWYLHLSFKHKKQTFRSLDKSLLADLRFKIQSIISVIENSKNTSSDEDGTLDKQFESDLIISLQFTEVILAVGNYHKDSTPFEFSLTGAAFSSQNINGKEEGSFQFIDCIVIDHNEKSKILTFESGLTEAKPGLVYKYKYQEGQLDSIVQICTVSLAYKVEYVQSLMKLTELIVAYVVEDKKSRSEKSPSRKQSAETYILDDPIIRRSSAKHSLLITCGSALVDLYFKKDIKSVSLSAQRLKFDISSQGLNSVLSSEITGAKIVDYNCYPYRKGQQPLKEPINLVSLKESGKVMFTFVTTEVDQGSGKVETRSDFIISGVVLHWIQQPMLRFVDFIIFQVLEIFYPTLVSFSKYYTKEDIIRGALLHLNGSGFLKQNFQITDGIVDLPSTVDPSKSIRLRVPSLSVENDRLLYRKIANKQKIELLPFEDLETDVWDIKVNQVRLAVLQGSSFPERTLTLEPFDFCIRVHYLTKLFELAFLYDLEDDLLNFDAPSLANLKDVEHKGFFPSRKEERPLTDLRNYSKKFITAKKKEKMLIDGRYHVEVSIKKVKAFLTNQLVNLLVEIIGNNINFDDGMDNLLRNRYETTDKVSNT